MDSADDSTDRSNTARATRDGRDSGSRGESRRDEHAGTDSAGSGSARRVTRRAALAATAAVGVAGCLGGGSDGVDCETPTTTTPVESMPALALVDGEPSVTVRVWEDLSCPHCATFATEVVPQLRGEFVASGDVRFVRHDFPIPVADWAWPAASAVRSVQARADAAAALEAADTIYERQSEYDRSAVVAAAESAAVEPCPILGAAATERFRTVVSSDRQRGRDRGVQGTPTVFVAGERVQFDAEIAYEPVRRAVENAL